MNKEKIEDANMGILNDLDGHKKLLVSFGGIRQGLGVPVFEFFNSISDIPCDKIFLRDFNQAWYQNGVDPRLNNVDKLSCHINHIIRQNKYDKICFLGNSMGAYAAILFGCKINVDVVISFAPQTFINRFHRIIYCDNRWQKQINNMYTLENKNKNILLTIK